MSESIFRKYNHRSTKPVPGESSQSPDNGQSLYDHIMSACSNKGLNKRKSSNISPLVKPWGKRPDTYVDWTRKNDGIVSPDRQNNPDYKDGPINSPLYKYRIRSDDASIEYPEAVKTILLRDKINEDYHLDIRELAPGLIVNSYLGHLVNSLLLESEVFDYSAKKIRGIRRNKSLIHWQKPKHVMKRRSSARENSIAKLEKYPIVAQADWCNEKRFGLQLVDNKYSNIDIDYLQYNEYINQFEVHDDFRTRYHRDLSSIDQAIQNIVYVKNPKFNIGTTGQTHNHKIDYCCTQYHRYEVHNGEIKHTTERAMCPYCTKCKFFVTYNNEFQTHLQLKHGVYHNSMVPVPNARTMKSYWNCMECPQSFQGFKASLEEYYIHWRQHHSDSKF